MIPMTMKDPFVVASGQVYVIIAHTRVNGADTFSAPNLSPSNPDATRPKPDAAFVMESK